jgi:hypothetical protein
MDIANLHDYVARVEKVVRDDLRGAQVIALVEYEVDERPEYWERIYMVAWQRPNQCGTHRVCINSSDEAMCVHGHYDLSRVDAIADMLRRGGRELVR